MNVLVSPRTMVRVLYWGVVASLLLPLGLIALMSLKDAAFIGFPIERLSPRWYGTVLVDREMTDAFLFSCAVAATSALVALLVGLWIALTIANADQPLIRAVLLAGACLPLVTPGIVSAIASRLFIASIGLDPGFVAIVFGHAVHSAPYVVLVVSLRLALMPDHLVEAAQNLGAGVVRAFSYVTLPWLAPAIGAAGLLALLESFDDFVRSFFLGGYRPTLPVLIYGRLFSGLSPEIGAITTMVLVLTVAIGLGTEALVRKSRSSYHLSNNR